MATDQTIRVSARGEFGQLQQGLKNLQGDLKNVIGEIDKGARKGGIFDESNLRALDVFKRRFQDSFGALEDEFNRQSKAMDKLWQRMKNASGDTQKQLQKEIDQRSKIIDQINAQMRGMQDLYSRRNTEASGFGSSGGSEGGGSFGGGGGGLLSGALGKLMGGVGRAGMFGLGLAGIGGIGSILTESYKKAYAREVNTLDLSQRLRGGGDYSGSNTAIYDKVGAVGMRNNMGYDKMESWQFMDSMSRQTGYVSSSEQQRLMQFARGYGLSTSEVSSLTGSNFQQGGATSASKFADQVSGSVQESGMTPRIVEVMEANNALLSQLNTTFKDGSSRQILAYQTTLDRIGNANGMQRLTGAQGANVIGGFGGIYQPGNDKWQWMGIRALQQYNPEKYGKMGMYDLQSNFEDGLMNKDNMPAMFKYMKGMSGGNQQTFQRMVQQWLQDGGFNATKSEVTELMKVTHNGDDLSNVNEAVKALQNGNSGTKYDERKNLPGQNYLQTDARAGAVEESIGETFLPIVQSLKEGLVNLGEVFTGKGSIEEKMKAFVDWAGGEMDTVGSLASTLKDAVKEGIQEALGWSTDPHNTTGITPSSDNLRKWVPPNLDPDTQKAMDEHQKKYADSPWETNPVSAQGNSIGDFVKGGAKKVVDFFTGMFGGGGKGDELDVGKMPKNIKDLSDKGKTDIKKLSDDGTGFFKNMDKETTDKMKSMDTTTATLLQKVYEEHKGIQNMLYFLFQPLVEFIKNKASGGAGGGTFGSGDFMTNVAKMIESNEGNYDTVTPDDNGALSIGAMQWHGNRARDLLKAMRDKDPSKFNSYIPMNSDIAQGLGNDWSSRTLGRGEASQVHKLLADPSFNGIQDQFASQDVSESVAKAKQLGISDPGAQAYFADLYNQSPRSAIEIAQQSDKSLDGLFSQSMQNSVLNPYGSRRNDTYSKAKALSASGGEGGGLDFLKGWQNKITSPFGDTDGRSTPHHGMDIGLAQGTSLGALAGGTIQSIKHDEANKTSGGNMVEVRMPNGQKFLYAHMSKINPNLQEGAQVGSGDWLGNSGGAPGVPGSGNDTTGAHLHMGYLDKDDTLMNPADLLNNLGLGGKGDELGVGNMPGKQSIDLNINFNVTGEGANQLNRATESQLESLVRKMINKLNYEKLSMNPSTRG